MKAILVKSPGGVEQLTLGSCPTPQPDDDQLLVKVHATALNRADLMQRKGQYPPPQCASEILGLEAAGSVVKVGANCSGWQEGDRVFALLPGGGYAEYAAIPGNMAMRIPERLSFEEAAAIPEVFLTAFQALCWLGRLQSGECVLIHAGASGVGTAAIQLVREAGATAFVTAGSALKLDFCLQLGAALGINYKEDDFAAKVLEATDGGGVELILDFIGAPYWQQNLDSLAVDGRLVSLALLGGHQLQEASLRPILVKRLQIIGSTLRARTEDYKARLTADFTQNVLPGFGDGRYKPIIDSIFPWQEVQEAHRRMEENKNIGKIVLRMAEAVKP